MRIVRSPRHLCLPPPYLRLGVYNVPGTGRAVSWEEWRSSKLYDAAASGCAANVDSLLGVEGRVADPDWLNPEGGLTPLLVATMNGRAACASMCSRV